MAANEFFFFVDYVGTCSQQSCFLSQSKLSSGHQKAMNTAKNLRNISKILQPHRTGDCYVDVNLCL